MRTFKISHIDKMPHFFFRYRLIFLNSYNFQRRDFDYNRMPNTYKRDKK